MPRNYYDPILRHIDRIKSSLQSIYNIAIRLGYSHRQILDRKARIWEDPIFTKLPRWAKSMIEGYDAALLDVHYRHLTWVHVMPDGRVLKSEEIEPGKWQYIVRGAYVYTTFFDKDRTIKEF